ncbi:MAG: fumarate hydratase C-terminal domain-containing protein [Clostridia bacterium]|nr:fumarate hydratase C-terminal domain-containing protein [Clostridia bacterium]
MSSAKHLTLPLKKEELLALCAGDVVTVTGTVYTARDAAHLRMVQELDAGKELPFPIEGACIYYAGPCPAAPGEVIGPCGPTTSSRMDPYTPRLIAEGLTAIIGKGPREQSVVDALRGNAVYFAATGGAGLLIASHIKEAEVIAYPELGTEAVRRLRVEDLPLIVAIDSEGNDLYKK